MVSHILSLSEMFCFTVSLIWHTLAAWIPGCPEMFHSLTDSPSHPSRILWSAQTKPSVSGISIVTSSSLFSFFNWQGHANPWCRNVAAKRDAVHAGSVCSDAYVCVCRQRMSLPTWQLEQTSVQSIEEHSVRQRSRLWSVWWRSRWAIYHNQAWLLKTWLQLNSSCCLLTGIWTSSCFNSVFKNPDGKFKPLECTHIGTWNIWERGASHGCSRRSTLPVSHLKQPSSKWDPCLHTAAPKQQFTLVMVIC